MIVRDVPRNPVCDTFIFLIRLYLICTDPVLLVVGEDIKEGAARKGKDRGGGYGGPQGEAVRSI